MTDGVSQLVAIIAALGATAMVVGIHFEGLVRLGRFCERRRTRRGGAAVGRHTVLAVMFGLLALHSLEILVFGAAYLCLLPLPGGGIAGPQHPDAFDALYLSATTYSTLGFGDVAPQGAMRWVAALEALVGLMMIAWSASFAFMEMSRHWDDAAR